MPKAETKKPKQARYSKLMLVRYGRMRDLGFFEHHESKIPRMPARVVIKTDRGLELGELVGQLAPYKGGQFKLTEQQICKYYGNSQVDFGAKPVGRFVRFATTADISEERHLKKIVEEEIEFCKEQVEKHGLPMKIIDAEHVFGGERIVFYFMAEGRVDFRALVKELAREYQSRIEMRQIGSRDEGKLLADVETCGQECCCRRFLRILKPVNMRMAKLQKATLDPTKISGYCGRLKCCLRYEDRTYTELKARLPRKNTRVKTQQGMGRIIDSQILTQLVMVERDDGVRSAYPLEEVEIIAAPAAPARRRPESKPESERQDRKPKTEAVDEAVENKKPDEIIDQDKKPETEVVDEAVDNNEPETEVVDEAIDNKEPDEITDAVNRDDSAESESVDKPAAERGDDEPVVSDNGNEDPDDQVQNDDQSRQE